MPTCCGKFRIWAARNLPSRKRCHGLYRDVGDCGWLQGASHCAFQLPRIGTQRNFAASGCHQGAGGILQSVESPAQHPGIQKIQNIFRENAPWLYHWTTRHPVIPAENNRAERELRPLVIARKLGFGSQSEQGLKTREVPMSVLHTLNKQTENLFATYTRALDALTINPTRNLYQLLFNSS